MANHDARAVHGSLQKPLKWSGRLVCNLESHGGRRASAELPHMTLEQALSCGFGEAAHLWVTRRAGRALLLFLRPTFRNTSAVPSSCCARTGTGTGEM